MNNLPMQPQLARLIVALDHTAVAVENLHDSITYYTDVLGLTLAHRETMAEQGVEAVLFDLADAHIELITPLNSRNGVGRWLEKHGPGLHHIAYRTSDIDVALATLASAGVRLIDERPRRGVRDSRVAFLHPSSCGGVLTEIVQPANHV
ncbi:MAG: methylmalonyl-CoA epimerase [Solirubrobacteraceae bacterium]